METEGRRPADSAYRQNPFRVWRRFLAGTLLAACVFPFVAPRAAWAELGYVARFRLEKKQYRLGEPIFCDFVIQNTGAHTFVFSYRSPSRAANQELPQEPRFTVTGQAGRRVFDPAPRLCGGAKGSIVYGSVTLPPGGTHSERWLLNQWARFTRPGTYHLRAERRLPLFALSSSGRVFSEHPEAFALALDQFSFEVLRSTAAQRRPMLEPDARILSDPASPQFTEAFLVATTLPQPFLLPELRALAYASPSERRWNSAQALEGLARLGTPAAWHAILDIARGAPSTASPPGTSKGAAADESVRAYAILLLGEKADPTFLPALMRMVSRGPWSLRDDALRALGFFRDPRAAQMLFEKLHSTEATERVNAILGLRNLESKNVIPALIAMLDDPGAQVRQVANFALENLTGKKFELGEKAPPAALARSWHAWWRANEAAFVPIRQAPCHDW